MLKCFNSHQYDEFNNILEKKIKEQKVIGLAATSENVHSDMYAQRKYMPACADAQADQSLLSAIALAKSLKHFMTETNKENTQADLCAHRAAHL